MKTLAISAMLVSSAFSQDKTPPQSTPISNEAKLELKNIDLQEEKIMKPVNEIVDNLLAPTRKQRNDVIIRECSRMGLDATKGQCHLDTNSGLVKNDTAPPVPATPAPAKTNEAAKK